MSGREFRYRWPEENIQTLRRLWEEGKSGDHIARTLHVTRGAVMGKLERLKLFGRPMAPKEPRKRCRLSDEGRRVLFQHTPWNHDRLGSIVGEVLDGNYWSVHWDGLGARSTKVYTKNYIEIVDQDATAVAIPEPAAERKARGNKAGGIMASIKAKKRSHKAGPRTRSQAATTTAAMKRINNNATVPGEHLNGSLAAFNAAIPAEQRKTLIELGTDDCHWPLWGDDARSGFYCGGVVDDNHRVYCATHARFGGSGYARNRSYGFQQSVNNFR